METYGALEGVDLTGVGLDLVSELHGLLSGLFQSLVVFTDCLVQVRHLRTHSSAVRTSVVQQEESWALFFFHL